MNSEDLSTRQAEVKYQLQHQPRRQYQAPKQRKHYIRDKVDYNTLHALYLDKSLPINEIARRINRTRQRVFQLLKEYGIHDKNRKQIASVCAFCHNNFTKALSIVNSGGGKYCCGEHYYEHKRIVGNYKENRQGKRIARRKIAKWLGIPAEWLPSHLIVHHEDGDCLNNDLRNLFVFPSHSSHLKYHHAKRNGNAVLPYQELWELPEKMKDWSV